MWPIFVILGGLLVWGAKKQAAGAPPGYERVAGVALDAQANALLASLESSGQQTLALGPYLARWEFTTDEAGRVKRVAALYRRT